MSEESEAGTIVAEQALPELFAKRRKAQRYELISVEAVEQFLDNLAQSGLLYDSADKAGLSYFTLNRLKKSDEVFAKMLEEAMECYREMLVREAHRRAVDGWDEPVFSQKLGTQIGVIRKYDSRLLELMLKRHIPEYREKFEGKIEIQHGVLVAPVAAVSPEDWAARHAGPQLQNYVDAPALGPSQPAPSEAPPAPNNLPPDTNGATLVRGG